MTNSYFRSPSKRHQWKDHCTGTSASRHVPMYLDLGNSQTDKSTWVGWNFKKKKINENAGKDTFFISDIGWLSQRRVSLFKNACTASTDHISALRVSGPTFHWGQLVWLSHKGGEWLISLPSFEGPGASKNIRNDSFDLKPWNTRNSPVQPKYANREASVPHG